MRTVIIGSGSWGVALGIHLAKLGNNIKIWSFAKDEAGLINNEKMIKIMMQQMGRTPSQKQINQMMKAMNKVQ